MKEKVNPPLHTCQVRLTSFTTTILNKVGALVKTQSVLAGLEVKGPIRLPKKIKRYTVLRSPHVNKKSREQFETRVHTIFYLVAAPQDMKNEQFLSLINSLQDNVPVGVAMKTKFECRESICLS